MQSIIKYCFLLSLAILLSCSQHKDKYIVATGSPGGTYISVGKMIFELLEEDSDYNFEILTGAKCNSPKNCILLLNNEADFGIVQNDVYYDKEIMEMYGSERYPIRTVYPLYDEILYVIYPDSLKPKSIRELLVGKRVCLSLRNSGTSRFLINFFKSLGIDTSEFTPVFVKSSYNFICDSIDVSCSLTGYTNPRIINMLHNRKGKIFTFDSYMNKNLGSAVDGVCMNLNYCEPYLIPKNTYKDKPIEPVLTTAVKSVLVTREDTDPYLVYKLVETLLDNKSYLAKKEMLLNALSDDISFSNLNFPMHEGTKMYVDRNLPTFFEKYSESIGVLLTIIIALIGGLKSFFQWNKRKKKNRIDSFYIEVLRIQKEMIDFSNIDEYIRAKDELIEYRSKAFKLLVDEELVADESFRIFTELLENTLKEIKEYIEKNK